MTTIVLPKPAKPDYTKAKAYCPIALENTMGKILESIVAELISYLTETYELLLKQHYGGRPGRTAEDAMLVLSENIHPAWKKGEIYSAIFLDVVGAFNNVHHKRLIYNMRKRRIPTPITQWLMSFLTDRTTRLRFNGSISEPIFTPAGIPQGSPLSPLLYIYYNGDLLDISKEQESSQGFIDDIAFGVEGLTDEGTTARLQSIMEEVEKWRQKHGVQFEHDKSVLIHFTANKRRSTDATITVAEITIKPSKDARYLGVTFDQSLKFDKHLQQATKKGMIFALAMSGAANCICGPQIRYIRQLFTAIVVPRTDYGAIIWHRPKAHGQLPAGKINRLVGPQRLAIKAIIGSFRIAPTSALQYEMQLPPPDLRLKRKVLQSLTRMQTFPSSHPISPWVEKATWDSRQQQTCHISNLESLARNFPEYTTTLVEKISPFIRPP